MISIEQAKKTEIDKKVAEDEGRITRHPDYIREAGEVVNQILKRRGITTLQEITDPGLADEVRAEIKSALNTLKGNHKSVPKAQVQGRPALYESILSEHQRKYPGFKWRMCNRNETIQSSWKAQGFEIFKDEAGNTFTDADLILMRCPMNAYVENVKKPVKERMAFRKKALRTIKDQFKESAAQAGVSTFGDIKFDEDGVSSKS